VLDKQLKINNEQLKIKNMDGKLIRNQEDLESLIQESASDWVYDNEIEDAKITVEITVSGGWSKAEVVDAKF